ncbi:LysR family transcriptional regulator [Sulfitobacter sp. JBTF-M27]|uniref:LysR family transcriptional regulator n=2 Tax=Sulfitobacter sediminilitoris TaxID=2698830 RepID=A0A6P0CL59_9RHOB|nr:LysR family transcriptional regulator [Sulfitobacter sediminilitoris]NEK25214.1 LysR family transcriptional regulator [Sulfitobacter sediminilitoris]
MKSVFQNLSDVRVFLAVLRAGSTLAASKTLGMAQPTVARRIEALEHALKLVLFERNTQGFAPTQNALSLVPSAEAVEEAAKAIDLKAAQLASVQSGTIRITAVMDAFNPRLSAILKEFVASYSNVNFELIPSDDAINISSGDADVAIRWTNKEIDDPSLICRKLTTVTHSLFASKSYAPVCDFPHSESDMEGHKYLVFGGNRMKPINKWLLERIKPDQIAMTCQDFKAMATGIQMGAGIGVLPTRFMKSDETLVQCIELPEYLGSTVWLIVNPTAYRRPEVKAFSAFFAPRYSAHLRNN